MVDAARTCGAVVDLARIRARPGDEFAQGRRGHRRVDDESKRSGRNRCHRHELLDRIVARSLRRRRDGRERRRDEQERVAVRIGLGCLGCPDGAARACAVLDHDVRIHRLAELVGNEPSDGIGAGTRRERDDQPDRLLRVRRLGRAIVGRIAATRQRRKERRFSMARARRAGNVNDAPLSRQAYDDRGAVAWADSTLERPPLAIASLTPRSLG